MERHSVGRKFEESIMKKFKYLFLPLLLALTTNCQAILIHTSKIYDDSNNQPLNTTLSGVGRAAENRQTSNYTLQLSDQVKYISMDSSSGLSLTVPSVTAQAFPLGTHIPVFQIGTGSVNFLSGSGVTVSALSGNKSTKGQYARTELLKKEDNWWLLSGDLVSSFITANCTGCTITTDGDYKVATFNASGTYTITSGMGTVESLVVGGGGAGGGVTGGGNGNGGGGGSGDVIHTSPGASYGPGSYPVTVGAGGVGIKNVGPNGSSSIFDVITAIGGGGGGSGTGGTSQNGSAGGSGGGAGDGTGGGGTGGSSTGFLGFAGGSNATNTGGAGGGGSGSLGGNGTGSTCGNGGSGTTYSITGSPVTLGGGGGGSGFVCSGNGGGGSGPAGCADGGAGTANTGGGGGSAGCTNFTGGNGASGVVVLRWKFQ